MKLSVIASDMFQQALSRLSEAKLTPSAAFKLRAINKQVAAKLADFHSARLRMLAELAEKDSDGKPIIENDSYKLNEENMASLQRSVNELLSQEISLPKLSVEELSSAQGVMLAQYELAFLEDIIDA